MPGGKKRCAALLSGYTKEGFLNMKKKLCAFLALAMLLCLLPVLAMAENNYVRVMKGNVLATWGMDYDVSSQTLSIKENGLTIEGVREDQQGGLSVMRLHIPDDVEEVTLKNVQLEGQGDSNVLDADSDVTVNVEGHTVLSTTGDAPVVEGEGNLTINVGKSANLEVYGPDHMKEAVY